MDLVGLRARLAAAGAPDVEVRTLAAGIVELVGSPDEPELADRLVEIASRTRGVDVVVNRLWTSGSEVLRPASSPSGVGSGPN